MTKKPKPSDILVEPDQNHYREAVKQLIEFEKEAFKLLNLQKLPQQYEVLNKMRYCLECYSIVLNQLNWLEKKTRTYKDNCRRMDEEGKTDAKRKVD